MYDGLLAFQLKSGDLADQVLGLGMTVRQMDHMAVESVNGDDPAFRAMVLMAWVGFDFDTNTVSPTPSDAVSVEIVDPSTVECLGDAELFISEGSSTGLPYNGLMAFQYKTGDLADQVLGFGTFVEQMKHAAVSGVSGTEPQFKAQLLVSWVGYDYDTDTVSATPADQVAVTIEDPDSLTCLGDAATFIGVSGGGGGGGSASDITYTPADPSDWGFGTEPTNVQDGLDELANRVATKTILNNASESRTFSQGVGALTLEYKYLSTSNFGGTPNAKSLFTLEIPAGSTADGGGAVISSNAISSIFRPVADVSFPCIVTDNGAKVFGTVTVATTGVITFSVGANNGTFTDDAAAGWDRITVTYGLA